VSGCSIWPDIGHGGLGEHHYESLSPVMPNQPLGPEHGLRFDLELTARHLDILVIEGADICFPATVVQAKQRQHRIERELLGGLEFDAANNLVIQRGLLARLERQLDYVSDQYQCSKSTEKTTKMATDIAQTAFLLLNSDNQFSFNSSELNPKYIGRLAEASSLLKQHQHFSLKVTGHADVLGKESYNKTLSLDRAKKVGRYLEIFGIHKSRLEISALSSSDPYFSGREPQNRLVNRRVSIELIETREPKTTSVR